VLDRGQERRLHEVFRLRFVAREMPRDLQQLVGGPIEHFRQRVEVTALR